MFGPFDSFVVAGVDNAVLMGLYICSPDGRASLVDKRA